MKCTRAHELIGELLEGTISSMDKQELEKHLGSCPDCRDLLADFQDIKTRAAELPRVDPSEAAWANILDGVRRGRRERAARSVSTPRWKDLLFPAGRPWFALGAAAALLIVGGALALVFQPWKGGAPAPLSNGEAFTMAKLEEAESHYRQAIQALTEAAASQKGGLDAVTAAELDKNLETIDALIVACRSAVEANPVSVEARIYLLGAYKGKVEFLDNIIAANTKSAAAGVPDVIL